MRDQQILSRWVLHLQFKAFRSKVQDYTVLYEKPCQKASVQVLKSSQTASCKTKEGTLPQKQDNLDSGLLGAFSPTLLKMQAGVKHSALWKKAEEKGIAGGYKKRRQGRGGRGVLRVTTGGKKEGKYGVWRKEEGEGGSRRREIHPLSN